MSSGGRSFHFSFLPCCAISGIQHVSYLNHRKVTQTEFKRDLANETWRFVFFLGGDLFFDVLFHVLFFMEKLFGHYMKWHQTSVSDRNLLSCCKNVLGTCLVTLRTTFLWVMTFYFLGKVNWSVGENKLAVFVAEKSFPDEGSSQKLSWPDGSKMASKMTATCGDSMKPHKEQRVKSGTFSVCWMQ